MSWYAVDALEDALDEARTLLLPFDLGTWVRLAVITAFAGVSAPQVPTVSWDVPPQTAVEYGDQVTDPEVLATVLVIAAAAVVLGIAFATIGSVMEFVLVDVLRSRDVRIAAPFGDRLGAGLRLLVFRVAVGVVVLFATAGVVAPVGFAVTTGQTLPLLALVVTVPLLLLVGVLAALVLEFTTAFVVPLMAEHGGGVLAGWRQFYPTLRAEWREFGVYVLVKLVLVVGAGFLFGIVAAVVAVPLGILAFAGAFTPLAFVAVGVAVLVGILVAAAVGIPLVTYFRYHSLRTLAASGAEFSLR